MLDMGVPLGVSVCHSIYLQAQDENENYVLLATPLNVTLTSTSSTGKFFSDDDCKTGVTSIDIPPDSSDFKFSYKDSTAGEHTLSTTTTTGVNTPTLAAASLKVSVVPVSRLAILGFDEPATQVVNSCGYFNVYSQDKNGAGIAVATETNIILATSSKTGGFFSDENCTTKIEKQTIPASQMTGGMIFYKDTVAQNVTLTASESPAQSWTKAALSVTITADQPQQ